MQSDAVLWGRVVGLGALQAAIALCWVVYHLFLPGMLGQFGFSPASASILLVIEGAIGLLLEPINGLISDRLRQQAMRRFLQVLLGSIFAALLFAVLPFAGGSVFAGLVLLWALAMTVFRAPAMALLRRYAVKTELVRASTVLAIMGGLASAFGGLMQGTIAAVGPLFAFALSSVLLVGTAIILRVLDTSAPRLEEPAESREPRPSVGPAALVFALGLFSSLGLRLFLDDFPGFVAEHQMKTIASAVVGGVFLASAITAYPVGSLLARKGPTVGLLVGLGGMALLAGISFVATEPLRVWGLVLLIGTGVGLLFSCSLPFAFGIVPSARVGWAAGLFFGGGALAGAVAALLGSSFAALSPREGMVLSAAMFSAAAICVILGGRYEVKD